MMHLPQLIRDLALILMTAGVAALLCRKLKQPVVLGYLVAGMLVGPHTNMIPSVVEMDAVKVWAELGIIFFLFHLGMEFSFKKLLRVGRPAFIAAFIEVFGMLGLGFCVGRFLNWSPLDALFLGAILSISSTAIIIKAFEEFSVKSQRFAGLVFGILIIEDLFAILILAFLSTVAATRSFAGTLLLYQLLKLLGFLIVVVPTGIYLFPRLLKKVRHYFNDESRVVFALGCCLGLVVLSSAAGFSPALGAFLMGAFMAETVESDRIERFFTPIKHWFGAIFFTSIGMLVNVDQMADNIKLIALISGLTIVGKILTTTAGMLLARQEKRVALQTGLSLAQIGEFSFIIATLGLSLNVTRPDLYPLAVAVSIVTTFSTPYLIRVAISRRVRSWGEGPSSPPSRPVRDLKPKIWDGHLVEFEIHPHFSQVGSTLEALNVRDRFNIMVVAINRGDRRLIAPGKDDSLMAFDRVTVLGTEADLQRFEVYLRSHRDEVRDLDEAVYEFRKIKIPETSVVIGKALRESGIRESIQGLVLGIERDDVKLLNPLPSEVMQKNDCLWVYGQRELIRHLIEKS